jgi:hypothetical protein
MPDMNIPGFDLDRFGRRLSRFSASPRDALREAMAEGAVADAVAVIVLANVLVAILCLVYFELHLKILRLTALDKLLMLPRMLVSANVAIAVSIGAHFLVGRAFGGRGTARDALVVFGFAALPTALLKAIRLFGPIPDVVGVLVSLAINGLAVAECHRFADLRPAIVTAIFATVASRGPVPDLRPRHAEGCSRRRVRGPRTPPRRRRGVPRIERIRFQPRGSHSAPLTSSPA